MQNALREQSAKLIHCSNLYHVRKQAELARFVVETMMQQQGKVFFCNSGAEANDSLIKLARKRAYDKFGPSAGKNEIITCQQSFHGRTLGGIAATGQAKVKIGFDPLLPGFCMFPSMMLKPCVKRSPTKRRRSFLSQFGGRGRSYRHSGVFCRSGRSFERSSISSSSLMKCSAVRGEQGDWCGWRTLLCGSGVEVEPDAVSWAKGFARRFSDGGDLDE